MIIKTNRDQLEGVVLLMSELLVDNQPSDIAELLVFSLVKDAYAKMRAKTETIMAPRSGYSINLTDLQAMALYIFLQNVSIPQSRYQYEAIQIQSISDKIHQQYGVIKPNYLQKALTQ